MLPIPIHPDPRCLHDLAPLGTRDRLERAAEGRPAPRFDLDEGDDVPAPGDEVELDAAHPKAVRHDLPTSALEITDRLLFTGDAEAMAWIAPIRGIAVNATRHAAEDIDRRPVQVIGKPLTGAELRTGSGDPEYIEEEKA